ncbi:MAG: carbamoyl-phosphate synthase large subunit, partial [Butyricicoccus sp.]
KVPRLPFDKFISASRHLTTQMKATGEVMSICTNFEGALMKALRSLEQHVDSLMHGDFEKLTDKELEEHLHIVDDLRIYCIAEALRRNFDPAMIHDITMIDRWFIDKLNNIVQMEATLRDAETLNKELLLRAKEMEFPDNVIGQLIGKDEAYVKNLRNEMDIRPAYKVVDTCAAEFAAETPYYYSCFGSFNEVEEISDKKKIMVLGSGPIRIGQGIEFDYCSVHSVWALQQLGCETIIVNNNPETVSTDFDTADRLYFEPLTPEDITGIVNAEKPDAAIVQFGGQTAINLAGHLEKLGVPILGTPAWSIDAAEDREKFDVILNKTGIPRAKGDTVFTEEEAVAVADRLGYPVLVRPSYVLGGQGMEIAYKEEDIREYMQVITRTKIENPVLVDKYLMGREIEVDAICDGEDILIPGIMEHMERAGIHSGDSISVYPSISIEEKHRQTIIDYTKKLSKELAVLGLVNIQFVLYNDEVYVIEVNPRSSRTIPYISKITGVPMVDLATRCMFGEKLKDMDWGTGLYPECKHYAVKVPVFSFQKLRGLDTQLGPEMKSTGEVLGVSTSFREALLKGMMGAGYEMKKRGKILISVRDADKQEIIQVAERFSELGFELYATTGTANVLNRHMVATNAVRNVDEPSPNMIDLIESGDIDYVIATSVKGRHPELGSVRIRRSTVEHAIPCLTAIDTANALLRCLEGDTRIQSCELVDINTVHLK